jgi:hypothetical protein
MEASVETYEFTADLGSVPETQAPFLCEIWNWQGDTSVLPYKVWIVDFITPYSGWKSSLRLQDRKR